MKPSDRTARATACAKGRLALALQCVLATVLAGCAAVGPDYRRPEVALPQTYPEAVAVDGAALKNDWWTLYGDAALNDIVASALKNNVDIRLAVAQIEEAEALMREAGAAYFPQVNLGAVSTRSRVSTLGDVPVPANIPVVRSDRQITASTSFEIDFWGKLRRAEEAVRAQALGTRYARDVVALTLTGAATQGYFALRSADAQIAVLRQTLASRAESLALARSRAQGGLASDLDVNQAEAALADVSIQMKELERQRAQFEHQLGTLSGRLDLRVPAGDLKSLPLAPTPPAGLPSALLERRPDIRAAEQNLAAANARIGIARSAMFPAISLTGSLGTQSAALSNLLSGAAGIWSLGAALAVPIFDAGRNAARTEQAEARQRQALASYQKTIETAFREVADAISNARASAASEEDLQTRANATRNSLRLARIRYEAGYSGFLEVLDAQRAANEAELALVRNRQARLAYNVDLMKALGGGWGAP